ncbi:Lrp/AsnC family transcriptional regulator [Marinobacterium sedimentorum]|uniref:Lrp/AsnC family transcriptional regulator n=1 Tax=Marinobacterium sedimentorum TaxID=2927804 RepID=UPI0020C70339|nr:Lrp/AsnC family transcriptional regulator [Marinobacterium sedimentorum]MCP8687213.1 Lrp/AsnC family transcriptional regulator [Marinobacterium sedimentorum]
MKKVALDAVDVRILSAVQQHGQISKNRLAELVNLSPTPCWLRLTKLKKAGLITGCRGQVAIDRILDLTKVFLTISLNAHKKSDFDRFEKRIQSIDEIVECCATGGGCDYVLKVITTSLSDFQALIEQLLDEEIGIDRYYIYVVTKEVKSTSLTLSQLMEIKSRTNV